MIKLLTPPSLGCHDTTGIDEGLNIPVHQANEHV